MRRVSAENAPALQLILVSLVIAAALAFLLVVGFVPFEWQMSRLRIAIRQRQQQRRTADRATEKTDGPQHERNWLRILQRRKSVVTQPVPTESEHRKAEQDFWRRTLRKQRNLNCLTFLGVLAAGLAFYVLLKTLDVSDESMRVSNRPYIAVGKEGTVAEWTFDKGKQSGVKIWFQNAGNTPAQRFFVNAQLMPSKPSEFTHLTMKAEPIKILPNGMFEIKSGLSVSWQLGWPLPVT